MNILNKITIKPRLEAKPLLLLVIWLFLIIIPYLLLTATIENLLKDSESRLLTKSKIQLIDEINDLRASLTPSYYLESKMAVFPNEKANNIYDAVSLANSLERHTNSKVAALFYLNCLNNSFEAYIREDLKKDLGLYSNYTMKNLLLTYASKVDEPIKRDRNISYFQNFLLAAGGINIQPETSTPILSGKENLGRMLGYFKTFGQDGSKEQMLLCLFREKDIPLKEITKNALKQESDSNIKREIINSNSLTQCNLGLTDRIKYKENYKFQIDEKEGLSITSITSDEMLVRLATLNTFYPLGIDRLLKNEPILKVTLPNSKLEHPMRDTVKRLRFPTLLLIMLISFGLIRIAIYGYTTNIRILGKVILCVWGAVILPFTSFLAVLYYNQYFTEEFAENEIEHYIQIQTEVISKAVESYIGNRELAIAELQDRLTGLSKEEFHKTLVDWRSQNGASIISYNYMGGKDTVIGDDENESISQLEKEAKDLFDLGIKNAFEEADLSGIKTIDELKNYYRQFLPNQISAVVSNIGKIYASIPNEPNSLFSLFPIYSKKINGQKEITTVNGSVLIKFDTYKILSELVKRNSGLLREMVLGRYIVRNAIIPITEEDIIAEESKLLKSENFTIKDIYHKLNRILNNKSKSLWSTKNSVNTASYLNIVNSIIACRAEKREKVTDFSKLDMLNIIIYIILMIAALSVMLGSIIVTPIRELQKASEKVANGDYSYKIETKTGDEFESLSEAFNEMTDALYQKEKMTSYVSKDVIEEVSNRNENLLQPSGERIPVSVLFCALSGKKELNEYSPEEVTKIISCLIDAADEISSAFNGQVDKLIEDTVMIVFRKSHPDENIALNASRAALAINNRLKVELPDFKIKMGIASGDAVSGKIGSRNGKLDYTVIGNPVNLAARLKVQAGKAKNTGILICPNSIRLLQGAGRLNFIERMTIKGRTNRTFPLYELIGLREYC